jgi:hypothetical protein
MLSTHNVEAPMRRYIVLYTLYYTSLLSLYHRYARWLLQCCSYHSTLATCCYQCLRYLSQYCTVQMQHTASLTAATEFAQSGSNTILHSMYTTCVHCGHTAYDLTQLCATVADVFHRALQQIAVGLEVERSQLEQECDSLQVTLPPYNSIQTSITCVYLWLNSAFSSMYCKMCTAAVKTQLYMSLLSSRCARLQLMLLTIMCTQLIEFVSTAVCSAIAYACH